jgi:hypothetical protein
LAGKYCTESKNGLPETSENLAVFIGVITVS